MNVVFVPRHIDKAPLLLDNAESASTREWEFLRSNRDGDGSGLLCL